MAVIVAMAAPPDLAAGRTARKSLNVNTEQETPRPRIRYYRGPKMGMARQLANGSGEVPLQVEHKTRLTITVLAILGLLACTKSGENPQFGPECHEIEGGPDSETLYALPNDEPAAGRRKSQIETYIRAHQGPGTQHLALLSNDIRQTLSATTASGIES